MLLAVSLLGCGSDEQMVVEEEENIQMDEVPAVEVAPETDICKGASPLKAWYTSPLVSLSWAAILMSIR